MVSPILPRNRRKLFLPKADKLIEDEPLQQPSLYPVELRKIPQVDAVLEWYVERQEAIGVDVEWFKKERGKWSWFAGNLIEEYGLHDVLSCITWMTSQNCRYYQYPFSLKKVHETMDEFISLRERNLLEFERYQGRLGELVNIKHLEEKKS